MATVMTETTTAKVREEQVTGLTAENAHRVTMIREKGTDHPPVPFHFRKEHHGTGNYVHLYGNPEDRNELHSRDFKDWEAVAFKHPGYLEDMWKQACDAYARSRSWNALISDSTSARRTRRTCVRAATWGVWRNSTCVAVNIPPA